MKEFVIIVGVNRGGTSAVAASLNALNIFLGELWHEPIYEDIHLARAFRQGDWEEFKKLVSRYNDIHDLIAWKLPNIGGSLEHLHTTHANMKYIFVFRDLFAIGNRISESRGTDIIDGMSNAIFQYAQIIQFIKSMKIKHICFSYEKMLINKELYARQLLDFLNIKITREKINLIQESISPNPQLYELWASKSKQKTENELRNAGYIGYIDIINHKVIAGWIKFLNNDSTASLDIYSDGKKINTLKATCPRDDLIAAGISKTGEHGFYLEFNPPLPKGTTVEAKPTQSDINIIGSPRKI